RARPRARGLQPTGLAIYAWSPSSRESSSGATLRSRGRAGHAQYGTWTDAEGTNETRPINCIDWYEAQAFCIWTGADCPRKQNGITQPKPGANSTCTRGPAPRPAWRSTEPRGTRHVPTLEAHTVRSCTTVQL